MAHDQVLFLTQQGRAHCIPAHKVPEASRTAGGTAIAQVGNMGVCGHVDQGHMFVRGGREGAHCSSSVQEESCWC